MHDGTCEDEKIGGDAEDAAREGGDEAANEAWRAEVLAARRACVREGRLRSVKKILDSRSCLIGIW